jgi:hypothetical protein
MAAAMAATMAAAMAAMAATVAAVMAPRRLPWRPYGAAMAVDVVAAMPRRCSKCDNGGYGDRGPWQPTPTIMWKRL